MTVFTNLETEAEIDFQKVNAGRAKSPHVYKVAEAYMHHTEGWCQVKFRLSDLGLVYIVNVHELNKTMHAQDGEEWFV